MPRSRVALLTTGGLEQKALPLMLPRLFPDVEFQAEYVDGFTSNRLSTPVPLANRPSGLSTNAEKLAKRMILALDPGRSGTPAHFAFAIDDLELANDDQPELVIDVFKDAVRTCLGDVYDTTYRQERCIREVPQRCSFHLLRPMTDAYAFGDPAALTRAGVKRTPLLQAGRDLEEFQVDDPDYRAAISEKAFGYGSGVDLTRHPKWYLRWLCEPSGPPKEGAYKERKQGFAALKDLDWSKILGPEGHCPFLRSLVVDLADALDVTLPFGRQGLSMLTYDPGKKNRTLRNI